MSTSDYTGPVLTVAAANAKLTDTFLAEYERRIVRRAQYEALKLVHGTIARDLNRAWADRLIKDPAAKLGLPWPVRSGGIVSDVTGLGQDPMERS